MKFTMLRRASVLLLLAMLVLPAVASATAVTPGVSSTDATTDIQNILERLVRFFAGPLAMGICIIAIVIAGIAYATTDGNKKQLFTVMLGVTIALFAAQLIAYFSAGIADGSGITLTMPVAIT